MRAFQEPGSWSLSFAGAGFLGLYHVGACQCLQERAPQLLRGARRFYGSSSGALNAVGLVCGKSADFCCSQLLGLVKEVERLSLGILHPAFWPVEHIRRELEHHLPADVHIQASQRLGISLTRWPDGQNCIITHFASREEVIQALICTLYIPFYCGVIPPEFRGERYIDGALSNNLPYSDCSRTITVSPFRGTVDICPQSLSASVHELQAFQACFQISSRNLEQGVYALLPPSPEVSPRSGCCGRWCVRRPQGPARPKTRRPACASTGRCPTCVWRTCPTSRNCPRSWRPRCGEPACGTPRPGPASAARCPGRHLPTCCCPARCPCSTSTSGAKGWCCGCRRCPLTCAGSRTSSGVRPPWPAPR
ncbi:patatin-like phospholipase domain-containing protein 5 isoform X2 [Sorex araneus]|uniref:patatin-like phospholipase domain-containing protein 5 isoform X2 n=1 Tax=Sorex araneus TaxID=42254 RepID=UPI002433AEEE|nr:patatin-like phospholipase domain-containing protein 5 isoform X2 [Sorex araneus]